LNWTGDIDSNDEAFYRKLSAPFFRRYGVPECLTLPLSGRQGLPECLRMPVEACPLKGRVRPPIYILVLVMIAKGTRRDALIPIFCLTMNVISDFVRQSLELLVKSLPRCAYQFPVELNTRSIYTFLILNLQVNYSFVQ
jgi:hypothetical protein